MRYRNGGRCARDREWAEAGESRMSKGEYSRVSCESLVVDTLIIVGRECLKSW